MDEPLIPLILWLARPCLRGIVGGVDTASLNSNHRLKIPIYPKYENETGAPSWLTISVTCRHILLRMPDWLMKVVHRHPAICGRREGAIILDFGDDRQVLVLLGSLPVPPEKQQWDKDFPRLNIGIAFVEHESCKTANVMELQKFTESQLLREVGLRITPLQGIYQHALYEHKNNPLGANFAICTTTESLFGPTDNPYERITMTQIIRVLAEDANPVRIRHMERVIVKARRPFSRTRKGVSKKRKAAGELAFNKKK